MNITICAVGRLRPGPESDLFQDYTTRFMRTGRAIGFGVLTLREVEARKGGGAAEEEKLLTAACPDGAFRIVLDERGKTLSSPQLADRMAQVRDDGRRDMAFLIGGADGFGSQTRRDADLVLSFGAMVWPHMLARVMLSEQLYRAASILVGAPYHRV